MRKTVLTIAGAAGITALTFGALNAQGGAAALDTSSVESGTYVADAGHSMVSWSVSHLGFNDYFGIFGDISGTLDLDVDDITKSSVDVTIPIASVVVPSEGLKGHFFRPGNDGAAPDFFGPNPEPARFVSTSVHSTGDTTAEIMGNLTLNGETHPVTIQAELSGRGTNAMNQKATLGFHGTATITRSQYNVSFGIPFGIPDQVPLEISVAFEK